MAAVVHGGVVQPWPSPPVMTSVRMNPILNVTIEIIISCTSYVSYTKHIIQHHIICVCTSLWPYSRLSHEPIHNYMLGSMSVFHRVNKGCIHLLAKRCSVGKVVCVHAEPEVPYRWFIITCLFLSRNSNLASSLESRGCEGQRRPVFFQHTHWVLS